MKVLKVYNEVHQEVKVEAAKSGRTTTYTASELLRYALLMLKEGKIDLKRDTTEEEHAA